MANKGFETEQIARDKAAADFAEREVYIIESNGQFYVEPADDSGSGFLRSWERQVFKGKGKNATKGGKR